MKKTEKLTSILLTVAMLLSLAPLTAFAAESDGLPTVIDVTDSTGNIYVETADPDGYVFTGRNEAIEIDYRVDSQVTFRNLTAKNFRVNNNFSAEININLEGNNELIYTTANAFFFDDDIVIIDSESGGTLSANVGSSFINSGGCGGTIIINGGEIQIHDIGVPNYHSSTIAANYIQNGGNVSIITEKDNPFYENVTLNGGSLFVSVKDSYILEARKFIVASGATFKGCSEKALIGAGSYFKIAEGEAENAYFYAKYTPDGEFELVKNAAALSGLKYVELKIDTHTTHSFENADECVCGIKKADYSGYYAAIERYNALTKEYSDILIEETKDYIRAEVQKIADEYLGGTGVKNNYTEDEQYILDGVADGLNKICDDIEKGIADNTFIKPDYEATEAKISDFENAHPDEEYKAFIAEIKAELDGIKASNPKSHADVEDDLAAIEAKIDGVENCGHMCHKDGIVGFFWKIINFFCKLFRINPICKCGIQHY